MHPHLMVVFPDGASSLTSPLPPSVIQRSDVGQQRQVNEDYFGHCEPSDPAARARGYLYVVADGMGGHAAGDVASQMAVETLLDEYYAIPDWQDPAQGLRLAIERANGAIYARASEEPLLREMGTTIVAVVLCGNNLTIANVGDSRGYLLRGGRLQQLTRDHSWVAKAVEDGVLTREQAREHPDRNIIYRSLGAGPTVEVELTTLGLAYGDRLLLCTDGLTDGVSDDEITTLAAKPDLEAAADALIGAANDRGGADNITVTLVALEGPVRQPRAERDTPRRVETLRTQAVQVVPGNRDDRATRPRVQITPEDDEPVADKKRWWQRRRKDAA
jgi:serine/threonine protein phosphatase PrpC